MTGHDGGKMMQDITLTLTERNIFWLRMAAEKMKMWVSEFR